MTSGVERLAKVAWIEEGQTAHEFVGAFVTGLNADGTVRVSYLDEEHPSVAAMSYYVNRQIGDNVVIRSNGDHWIVLGRIGLEDVIEVPVPPGDPGGPGPTLLPSSFKNYAATEYGPGTWLFDRPFNIAKQIQGYNGGFWPALVGYDAGPWACGYYFGETLRDAFITNTITKAEIKFKRSAETAGNPAAITPKIYFHQLASAGADLVVTSIGPYNGPALTRGAEGWFEIPPLMFGSATSWRGFYIASEDTSAVDFLICDPAVTGEVRTTL